MKARPKSALHQLASILDSDELSLALPDREKRSGDKWFAARVPDAVAFPRTADSVSRLLRFCSERRIPVTPRGSGFGYVGGCVPVEGGVALSLERMNRILEINPADFVAVAQPGVILGKFQDAVEKRGLFYPPDPASRADCSLGGTVATNAGGPRCLKYGVTRDYILGLQVALAGGAIAVVGGRAHKNKTGFDLTRLFVGSEGLLGVVTEITVKLLPLPPSRALLVAGFDSMRLAARAMAAIFAAGFLPSALEVADEFTLRAAARRTGRKELAASRALVMTELDGQAGSVRLEAAALARILRARQAGFIQKAVGHAACEKLWGLRREFSFSLRDTGLVKLNEDIVVPRGRLEDLFRFTAGLQKKFDLPVACFGHAGDGNIHVNIMYDPAWPDVERRTGQALDALFRQTLAWGGVITGEHGIGLAKKRWWPDATSPETRALHRQVKRALDPNHILNPGKFV